MSQYYLMAQLPSLDGISESAPLPITEERFLELCEQFLDKKTLTALKSLTLVPEVEYNPTGFKVIDEFMSGERSLRLALGSIRAVKLKKSVSPHNKPIPADTLHAARTAAEMNDPLAAEKYLNKYRLNLLEALRPLDSFCDESVFYYALKLKLILRIKQFDEIKGKIAYENIYNSILHGDFKEAE